MPQPNKYPPEFIERVQQFAHSDEVQVLLDALVEKYSESWRNTSPERPAEREHLYRMVRAVEGLKTEIRSIALDQVIEAHNRGLRSAANWSNI